MTTTHQSIVKESGVQGKRGNGIGDGGAHDERAWARGGQAERGEGSAKE